MQYSHTVEEASKYSSLALEKISKEGLPATPEIYELWYVYYSDENPEVKHALDILEPSKEGFTQERCQEIYQRFLSESTENERVRQAGNQIQSTIQDVSGLVSNVKTATSKYKSSLGDVTGKLQGEPSKDEIELVLQNVMSNTEDMIKQNQELEEELTKSSQIMLELQRDLELVRKEALTDGLTNLANRKAFDAEIKRLVREAEAEGLTFCLIMMDIDHFKSFNDNYGHQVGDQVLRLVARTLTDGVKGRDIAARFGGEEFAILLPETNLQAGVKVGDYLRKAVANKEVINRNSGETLGRITLSGGVAQYLSGESHEDLLERADAALYTAKHNGRNQVCASPAPGQKKAAQ